MRKIVVAGARGIVGRGFLEFMAGRDVELVALGRRAPIAQQNVTHVPVDLTRPAEVAALAPALAGASELVYAAVSDDDDVMAGWGRTGHSDRNRAMFAALLDVLESASDELRHVLVLQGTKAYGTQLGRFTLPARESDPRPLVASFYWPQEDLLRDRQVGQDEREATVTIREQTLSVEDGHRGTPGVHVIADSATWLENLRRLSASYLFLGKGESAPPEAQFVLKYPKVFHKLIETDGGTIYSIDWPPN